VVVTVCVGPVTVVVTSGPCTVVVLAGPVTVTVVVVVGPGAVVVTVEAALRGVDRRYEDAARTLGASPGFVLRHITLPSIRGALGAGAALAWARALGEFGATVTFAGNLQGVTRTMPLAVYLAMETDPEAALALVGAARRLGISAKAREVRGVDRVVIRDGDAIIVADPGLVASHARILDPLRARGIDPADVTHVFFSHHHPDHTMNAALFPEAEVVDFWARYRNDLWLDPSFRDWNIDDDLERIHCPILAILGAPGALTVQPWFARDAVRTAARELSRFVEDLYED